MPSSSTKFSEETRKALEAAKKAAVASGKRPRREYGNAVPVEGWDLLNGLHFIAPKAVEKALGSLPGGQRISPDSLPWLPLDDMPDKSIEGIKFRVTTPKKNDYISQAGNRAGEGNRIEPSHLLEAIVSDPDPSLQRIWSGRSNFYPKMREHLRNRIVGQDICIDALIEGLKTSRMRLDEDKPFSFAFLGPTGVGKTELVKQLADFLFGEEEAKSRLLTLNMSRYQMDTAHELIFGGSPYKGQPGEGLLFPFFSRISRKIPGTGNDARVYEPYCIILLDEIEKAHESTVMGFLNLIEEGLVEVIHEQKHHRFHLTSRTLVFLTSNAGAALYEDPAMGSRFLQNQELIKQSLRNESPPAGEYEQLKVGVERTRHGFRPEFLSRIDRFIVFSHLGPSHMEKIAEIGLSDLSRRIRDYDAYNDVKAVSFDDGVKTLLSFKDGFQYGVRNLKTLIETTFVPPLVSFADDFPTEGIKRIHIELRDQGFLDAMCVKPENVRVLAIDDPEDLRDPEDYRNHFTDLGFQWDSASTVSDAIALLRKNRYLFVLMDLDFGVLRQIRRRFPHVPVFLFSDDASREDIDRVLQAGGARDFLRKDLDEEEVQRQLRLFEQLSMDQRRTNAMHQLLSGQANGFSFELAPILKNGEQITLRLQRVEPTCTPRIDDLGLYTQKKVAVSLDDVQGIEGIRAQVEELVQILNAPATYLALGAHLPKGVLLYGPPGTGKTMLAQAIAYETGLPFLYTSSSALAGRYARYGHGALSAFFARARRNAPCVIFIDEIEGVGRARTGLEASTLLQGLLTGLDSIRPGESILFVGATNRPDILDPALLRPGRFDRKYAMEPPGKSGREGILKRLLRDYDTKAIDTERIARLTFGFTGAQIVNLLNESALAARREGKDSITTDILAKTIDLVKFGPETDALKDLNDRRQVAVHELGHAILTAALDTGALNRVTLISRAHFLGMSEMNPDETGHGKDRGYWVNRIAVCLGGRVAETLVYGDIKGRTTGVESDMETAIRIALRMVCQWSMAPGLLGALNILHRDYLDNEENEKMFFSEKMARAIDHAVQALLAEAEEIAGAHLEKYRDDLPAWADLLVEKEEMSGAEISALLNKKNIHP